jgi:hypothetical protein
LELVGAVDVSFSGKYQNGDCVSLVVYSMQVFLKRFRQADVVTLIL